MRHAFRTFASTPGVTAAAVLSLAIGIGANTALFSVANALLFRPLPYADADRLVILWNRSPGLNIAEDWFSTAQFFDIKTGHRGFEDLAIAIGANYNLTGSGDPERVGVMRVSSNLLPMLGAEPEAGQLFVLEDDVPGRPPLGLAEDSEIFLPLPLPAAAPDTRTREDYNIIGKLKRGVSIERAQREMDGIT